MVEQAQALQQGYVLWEGPSSFDSKPIVVLATGFVSRSSNVKTGEMIQVYILRQDKNPSEVLATIEDKSICNNCKHGAGNAKSCYVDITRHGINGVWKAYRDGKYRKFDESLLWIFDAEIVRFGAYGDPAAAPYDMWDPIVQRLVASEGKWTSYTHSWLECDQRFKFFTVASVDTPGELQTARDMGWRTYRTLLNGEELAPKEFVCPASDEWFDVHNRKVTCLQCAACDGNSYNAQRGSAAIRVHGNIARTRRYHELRINLERQGEVQP